MGTAGFVRGGLLVVGRGCLPWCCVVVRRGMCCCVVLTVWRALLARACCGTGAGTHSLSDVSMRGSGVGACGVGSASPPCLSPLLALPSLFAALPYVPSLHCARTNWVCLGWLGWLVVRCLRCLTWCFFPAGKRGLGLSWGWFVLWFAHLLRRAAHAVSWATWLLFTGVHPRCVVLRVQCPMPIGSCLTVCVLGAACCVCGVLGYLAPVHRYAGSACCVVCAVSGATWLLFTGVLARFAVLRVRCPGPLRSCSPVCTLGVPCCVCGVLGHLGPVHRCACSVCCVACAVSWAPWLLFTSVYARCAVLRVPCLGPLGFCSAVYTLGVLCFVCRVLGHFAPIHRYARLACRVASAVSWASWLLFKVVHTQCAMLRVRCPGSLGSCSPVCTLCLVCCMCGVCGHLAPVHHCACSLCCVACAVSWASWLLFTGAFARRVPLRVWCQGPLGSRSLVCSLGVLCCMCGVLGLLVPDCRCACLVCGVLCAVYWASWLLFTGVHPWCLVPRVRCPGPLGSCSPVCTFDVLRCVHVVFCHLAPAHRCARSVCCGPCAVSWAPWHLFTGVHGRCVVWCVRCPGPLGSCSLVCLLGVLCRVCGVLGLLAPVHRCARSVCCVVCAVSWATWLLIRCARSVCCVACAVSWAAPLQFTGVHVRCVVCRVRCPRPLGSCSAACMLGLLCHLCGVSGLEAKLGSRSPFCKLDALCGVCGVLGLVALVQRRARSVCCVAGVASWMCAGAGYVVLALWCVRVVCWMPGAACVVCAVVVWVWVGCVLVVWCAWFLGFFTACATPSSLHIFRLAQE